MRGARGLPRALATSAERFGSIGIASTYLTRLYVISFALLTTAVLGQVISADNGRLGRRILGRQPSRDAEIGEGAAEEDWSACRDRDVRA